MVIVTVFDESGRSPEYITLQKENRVQYAEKNGA